MEACEEATRNFAAASDGALLLVVRADSAVAVKVAEDVNTRLATLAVH
jgi:hypothetical protein